MKRMITRQLPAMASVLFINLIVMYAAAQAQTWTPIGPAPIPNGDTFTITNPVSGRVTAIAVHPTNPDTVYVGTANGGLYRTQDGGTTWTQLMETAQSLAIGAVAISPINPSTIFVGTGEGNLTTNSFFGVGLYVITNADTAPALSGPFGQTVFANASITKIVVHPTDDQIIFVGTGKGIGSVFGTPPATQPALGLYRSINAQSATPTFTKLTVQTANGGNRAIGDMVMEPGNPNVIVAYVHGLSGNTDGGVWRTSNALAASPTWTQTLPLGTNTDFQRAKLAVNKVGTTVTVFAATAEIPSSQSCPVAGQGGVLRRSTDGGQTWPTTITTAGGFCGLQCFYDIAVAVDPANASNVYLGGGPKTGCSTALKKTTNGGTTFPASDNGLHAATFAIAVAPSNPSVVYTGNDGGIFRSSDAGATWTSLNNALFNGSLATGIAVHPTDPNYTLVGTQGNGAILLQADNTWRRADKGDGGFRSDGGNVLIDRNASDTTTVTMYHTYFSRRLYQIGYARVINNGNPTEANWTFFGCSPNGAGATANGISCSEDVFANPPIALGPGNPNTFYFATDRLYRSTDRGTTLSVVSQAPLFSGKGISAIGISPQNDNVRIVGVRNGKVYMTTNGSSTLTDVTSPNFPASDFPPDPSRFVTRVVIDPNNQNTAYVTFSGYGVPAGQHIWKTTNLPGGANTWVAAGSGIPDEPVNAFVVDSQNSNNLYAGTDRGVYRSTDGGVTWTAFGTGLPRVPVFDMAIQNTNRVLRIATYARGVWEIALAPPEPPPAAPSGLQATAASSSQVDLTWTDNSANETSFNIERCTGAGCTNFGQIAQTSADATSYSDTTVSHSNTYVYRVRAAGAGGNSDYSNESSATTPPPPAPADPSGLTATPASSTQVNLAWTDGSTNEDGFKVERCQGSTAFCDANPQNFAQVATAGANATAYSDTTAQGNTTYAYRVRAFNVGGDSNYTNTAEATTPAPPPPPPAPPSNLLASAVSQSQVDLSWTDNSGDEDGFKIERCQGAGCNNFGQIDQVNAGVTNYSDLGRAANTSYSYRLRAFSTAGGDSAYSNTASATTPPPPPPADPTGLTATAASSSQINLAWTDNASDESGFRIERCEGASCTNFVEFTTVGANVTSFQNTALAASTTYRYRVRAFNAGGNSGYTNEAEATTQAASGPPAAPSGLTGTAVSTTQINLSWTDNSSNETGFEIERCQTTTKTACTNFANIATVAANTTTYSDGGRTANSTYRYRVRAVNAAGNSSYSNIVQVKTPRK